MSRLPSFNLAATIEKIAGPVSNGYAARLRTGSLNEVVIAVMVEKRECVEDLDAILAVEGVDMVQFDASDFSMSLGLTGQRNHPDVVRAERLTIEKGLHPRVEFADIKQAWPYLEMGVKHFCTAGMFVSFTTGGGAMARACGRWCPPRAARHAARWPAG